MWFQDWNYLRVRGEYNPPKGGEVGKMELPPRTRRIRRGPREENRNAGTTSAYAENTWCGILVPGRCGNYLRVRGEYEHDGDFFVNHPELPPRTRRILQLDNMPTVPLGTTSAYAENTGIIRVIVSPRRNYLRVRGEYGGVFGGGDDGTELPPRTRRILAHELGVTILMGTTSAYAENTADDVYVALHQRNYLRVRGEYDSFSSSAAFAWELPPRTRRIPRPPASPRSWCGTTSAYAENTR